MNNNSLLLLGLGVAAFYLYEKSKATSGGGANQQVPCADGYTFVNNTCVQNPFTSCPTGYTDVNGTCYQNPYTLDPVDPISQLLDNLTSDSSLI